MVSKQFLMLCVMVPFYALLRSPCKPLTFEEPRKNVRAQIKNVGEKVPLQKSTASVHRADAEALNIVVFICLL
jgi:hypothetical protein